MQWHRLRQTTRRCRRADSEETGMTDDRPPRDIAIGGGNDIDRPPWGPAFKALAAASLNGKIVGSEAGRQTRELLKVVAGSSTVAPSRGDKCFAAAISDCQSKRQAP